jgi:16S rRNA (uracil1498-N3)-methyltransferase
MRFFVDSGGIDKINAAAVIEGADARHITVSLRLGAGDVVTLCDGTGTDYACEIVSFSQTRVNLRIVNVYASSTESEIKVTLFQALPKHGKMEFIIEKCVELGVYEIVPVVTRYTMVNTDDEAVRKIRRYERIAESAAKQCNRGFVPVVREPVGFGEAIEEMKRCDIAIAPWERETKVKMRQALEGFTGVTAGIIIGPEGGFSEDEAAGFRENNIRTVNLGKRILRTETAGLVALTIFFNEVGEF